MWSDYYCEVCKEIIQNDEVAYQIYKKKVEDYSDCMAGINICTRDCLVTFALNPLDYIEVES